MTHRIEDLKTANACTDAARKAIELATLYLDIRNTENPGVLGIGCVVENVSQDPQGYEPQPMYDEFVATKLCQDAYAHMAPRLANPTDAMSVARAILHSLLGYGARAGDLKGCGCSEPCDPFEEVER